MERHTRDSLWEDPDETPRHSLVWLFDDSSSGGSTPLNKNSNKEPDTDDRMFLKVEDEETSDPSYEPTDEEEEELSLGEETKVLIEHGGGDWITDGDGDQVWVSEEK